MGYIKEQFDKICRKCITKFAVLFSLGNEAVQIVLFLKYDKNLITSDQAEAVATGKADTSSQDLFSTGYLILKNYQVDREISVMELIDRKIDFMGKSYLLSQKIKEIIIEMCGMENLHPDKIRIIIFMKGQIILASLYTGAEFVKALDLSEVLNDLKMLQNEEL